MASKALPRELVSLIHHVELNKHGWWDKAIQRLVLAALWVSSKPVGLEELAAGYRHRKWRYRLESVVGKGLFGPAILRQRLESLLPSLGGTPPPRSRDRRRRDPLRDFEQTIAGIEEMLAMMYNRPRRPGTGQEPSSPEANPAGSPP